MAASGPYSSGRPSTMSSSDLGVISDLHWTSEHQQWFEILPDIRRLKLSSALGRICGFLPTLAISECIALLEEEETQRELIATK